MNITEYAKQMGTSKTTLYRKIAEAGLDISDLRGRDGQLTNEGLSTLSALLDETLHRRTASHKDNATDGDVHSVSETGQITELERKLAETHAALDAALAQITELHRQAADRERQHAEAWQKFSERQQQIEAQRLAAAPRRGILKRLHDLLFADNESSGKNNAK